MEYELGAIKQDPESKAVAIRSDKPADGELAWGVFHPSHGGHWAPLSEVEEWGDMIAAPVEVEGGAE